MKGIAPLRTVSGNGASNIIISYRDVFLTPLGMDEEQAAGWLLEGRTRLDGTAAAKDDGFQTIERPPFAGLPGDSANLFSLAERQWVRVTNGGWPNRSRCHLAAVRLMRPSTRRTRAPGMRNCPEVR